MFEMGGVHIADIEALSTNQVVSFNEEGLILGFSFICGDIPIGDHPSLRVYFDEILDPLVCISNVTISDVASFAVDVMVGPCHDFCSITGDVNGDGQVDILDVVGWVGLPLIISEYIVCDLDLNQDGDINVLDVIFILNIILGISSPGDYLPNRRPNMPAELFSGVYPAA